jgi:hypothetical protein
VVDIKLQNMAHGDSTLMSAGELTLVAPYRNLNLRLGEDVGPPWNLEKLAQIVLTKPDFLKWSHSSCSVVIPSSDTVRTFTFVQVMKDPGQSIFLLLLEPVDGSEIMGRKTYRRVAVASVFPYECGTEDSWGEEQAGDLADATYLEIAEEEWPTGKFVIV